VAHTARERKVLKEGVSATGVADAVPDHSTLTPLERGVEARREERCMRELLGTVVWQGTETGVVFGSAEAVAS
jgi:hypothetical protein